ncbi:hypothetical protein COLO4_02221, partial [Corchorus olitorius]
AFDVARVTETSIRGRDGGPAQRQRRGELTLCRQGRPGSDAVVEAEQPHGVRESFVGRPVAPPAAQGFRQSACRDPGIHEATIGELASRAKANPLIGFPHVPAHSSSSHRPDRLWLRLCAHGRSWARGRPVDGLRGGTLARHRNRRRMDHQHRGTRRSPRVDPPAPEARGRYGRQYPAGRHEYADRSGIPPAPRRVVASSTHARSRCRRRGGGIR